MTSELKYFNSDREVWQKDEEKDIRKRLVSSCVRSIVAHKIPSLEFLQMSRSMQQLSQYAHSASAAGNTESLDGVRGRAEGSGTLWDQDLEQDAIRTLVEDAKVSIALRVLNDYMRWELTTTDADKEAVAQELCSRNDRLRPQDVHQKHATVEESLGYILFLAMNHVEAMQLMDCILLVEHIAMVLEQAPDPRVADNPKMQATLVLQYFFCLCKHVDELNTEQLLARMEERQVLLKVVRRVLKMHDWSRQSVGLITEGISFLCSQEDFQTSWTAHLPDQEARVSMLEYENVTNSLLTEADAIGDRMEWRRGIRPLLDFYGRVKRGR